MAKISKEVAIRALTRLDEMLDAEGRPRVRLIIGGGGSMVLAHGFPGATAYVDSLSTVDFADFGDLVTGVSIEFKIPGLWLNPHYSAYAHYLPSDYGSRLLPIFSGKKILAQGLGAEDLLIMKLMAGRSKDMKHIKFLMRASPSISIIESRLEALKGLAKQEASSALDLLDSLLNEG